MSTDSEEENLPQHQVLVSDLDLSSKIGSKKIPCMALTQGSEAIYSIITYPDGRVPVITHCLLSNSPHRPQRRTHIRGYSITHNNTNTRTS